MGILTGKKIIEEVGRGCIEIDPFDETLVNPASIDLKLGREVRIYEDWVNSDAYEWLEHVNKVLDHAGRDPRPPFDGEGLVAKGDVLDVKNEPITRAFIIGEEGWVLWPGILYLMHTEERVCTRNYAPVLDGKSSIGRLGIVIHLTAGYGDPGFDGQYTLEVTVAHPVRVYAGMRFCQMRFHTLMGKQTNYQSSGHYTGKDAVGPVASKAFTQFK